MKILFLRESEGVYKFGKRRVHVKVERGNEVLVRVGGGFISAQQFIETYMPSEVEKVERQDVVGRFNHKLISQKISANQSTYSHESSPIRSPRKDGSTSRGNRTRRGDNSSTTQNAMEFNSRTFAEMTLQSSQYIDVNTTTKKHYRQQSMQEPQSPISP